MFAAKVATDRTLAASRVHASDAAAGWTHAIWFMAARAAAARTSAVGMV